MFNYNIAARVSRSDPTDSINSVREEIGADGARTLHSKLVSFTRILVLLTYCTLLLSSARPITPCLHSIFSIPLHRDTDLFAKMAKAASMTAASMGQEDDKQKETKNSKFSRNDPGASPPLCSRTHAGTIPGAAARNNHSSHDNASPSKPGVTVETRGGRNGMDNEEEEGQKREGRGGQEVPVEAVNEFERLAKTLQRPKLASTSRSKGEDTDVTGVEVMGASNNGNVAGARGPGSKNSGTDSNAAMDVDSDEEETVALTGEFHKVNTTGVGVVVPQGNGEGVMAAVAAGGLKSDDGVGDEDDDLASAVKPGKGRSKGRGRGKVGSKGKNKS